MRIFKELKILYQGGNRERIRLQNDSDVKRLAEWLLESESQERWKFYLTMIKEKATAGGSIILCERGPRIEWLKECTSRWKEDSKDTPISIISKYLGQIESTTELDWDDLSKSLINEVQDKNWIIPSGDAILVCSTCNHHLISDWSFLHSTSTCDKCASDVFIFFPVSIKPTVKAAIIRGLLLEIVVAKAVEILNGEIFCISTINNGSHYVSLQFDHPISSIECDVIAEFSDTVLLFECKELKSSNLLGINTIELTLSKFSRLLQTSISSSISEYSRPPKVIFVTSGKIDSQVEQTQLQQGGLSSLSCFFIDRDELHLILNRLIEISGV